MIIYTSNAQLKKLQNDSADADKEGYVTLITSFKINVQPAGPEFVALTPQGEIGKTYLGFTTRSGIQENMLVVTSGTATASGMRLSVRGVEEWHGPLGKTFRITMLRSHK